MYEVQTLVFPQEGTSCLTVRCIQSVLYLELHSKTAPSSNTSCAFMALSCSVSDWMFGSQGALLIQVLQCVGTAGVTSLLGYFRKYSISKASIG